MIAATPDVENLYHIFTVGAALCTKTSEKATGPFNKITENGVE